MNAMNSILTSTKKLAGLGEEYNHFDPDIIMYINQVFLVLKQLGVGPAEGFVIESAENTWEEFLPDDKVLRESTKGYMGDKVRMKFDPPLSSAAMDALVRNINEFEWRLNVEAETP